MSVSESVLAAHRARRISRRLVVVAVVAGAAVPGTASAAGPGGGQGQPAAAGAPAAGAANRGYTAGFSYFDGPGGGVQVSGNSDRVAVTGFLGVGAGGSVTAGEGGVPSQSSVGFRGRATLPGGTPAGGAGLQFDANSTGSMSGAFSLNGNLPGANGGFQAADGLSYNPATGFAPVSSDGMRSSLGSETSAAITGTVVVPMKDINNAMTQIGEAQLAQAQAEQAASQSMWDGLSAAGSWIAGKFNQADDRLRPIPDRPGQRPEGRLRLPLRHLRRSSRAARHADADPEARLAKPTPRTRPNSAANDADDTGAERPTIPRRRAATTPRRRAARRLRGAERRRFRGAEWRRFRGAERRRFRGAEWRRFRGAERRRFRGAERR